MKVEAVCSLIFVALGFSHAAETAGERGPASAAQQATYRSRSRSLKGKGPKSIKGAGTARKNRFFHYLMSDKEKAMTRTNSGYAFAVDLYERGIIKPVGTWYESITYTESRRGTMAKGTSNERGGVGIVSITFNKNAMIALNTVTGQRKLAIIGGSGKYGSCIGGFAERVMHKKQNILQKRASAKASFELQVYETC